MIAYCLEEILRLTHHPIPLFTTFILRISRCDEKRGFIIIPIYLAIGVLVALRCYPTPIAYASVCIAAVGDPVAAIVGRKVRYDNIIRGKTILGSSAGLIAAFLAASLFVVPFQALVGSVGAMIMEAVDVPDDNLTMPIVAGASMMLTTLLLN